MRIVRIEIERFRGIKKLSLEINSSLQLIAGPNNAGKTTIIKAIELFFSIDGGTIRPELFAPKNTYYEEEGSRALTKIRLYFGDLTDEELNSFSEALLPRNKTFWNECRISRTGSVSYASSKSADGQSAHSALLDRFSLIHIPVLRVGEAGMANSEAKRLVTAVREVLVRQRPGKQSDEQRNFSKQFGKWSEIVLDVLNKSRNAAASLLPQNSSIEFELPQLGDVLDDILGKVWIRTRPGVELGLRDEGTGYQSLLSLGLLKYASRKLGSRGRRLLFLVEEPEVFLHPQYQRAVSTYLNELAGHAQVLVTTHSPTIIDATNITNILRLERMEGGLEWDWKNSHLPEASAGRLYRYCDSKNSELIFSDRIVLCEGITDAGVVREIIRRKLGIDPHRANISIIDMQSGNNARHFVELSLLFKIPYLLIVDKDFYTGNRNSLKQVLKLLKVTPEPTFYNSLDALKQTQCSSFKSAGQVRDEANSLLQDFNVFTWAADIEGAVASSFKKKILLASLGPQNLSHFSQESVDELRKLSGAKYHFRLHELVGSKGWNSDKKSDQKPRQHVLPHLMADGGAGLVRNSDISKLMEALTKFLNGSSLSGATEKAPDERPATEE